MPEVQKNMEKTTVRGEKDFKGIDSNTSHGLPNSSGPTPSESEVFAYCSSHYSNLNTKIIFHVSFHCCIGFACDSCLKAKWTISGIPRNAPLGSFLLKHCGGLCLLLALLNTTFLIVL